LYLFSRAGGAARDSVSDGVGRNCLIRGMAAGEGGINYFRNKELSGRIAGNCRFLQKRTRAEKVQPGFGGKMRP
jgi:hypothetical protein